VTVVTELLAGLASKVAHVRQLGDEMGAATDLLESPVFSKFALLRLRAGELAANARFAGTWD
jgi:hypothetical protein